MAKGTKSLNVRIDTDTFDKFNKYTKTHDIFTQAKIVENLIKYFMKQNEEQKHLLVMGVGVDYLNLLGEALQLVNWGDHAFRGYETSRGSQISRGSFLPWIIETYNRLNELSAKAQKPWENVNSPNNLDGILFLRRIAWFKLGAAWIKVAMELRTQALVDLADYLNKGNSPGSSTKNESKPGDWNEVYDASIYSLRVAIANYHLFNKSLEKFRKQPHPTVLYNQACTWSLIAQYITEQNATNKKLDKLAQAAFQEEEKRKKTEKQTLEACSLPSGIVEADIALQKANECLQKITIHYPGDAEDMPFADAQWLFDYAESDPDIACFRKSYEKEFEKWLRKRTARISLLDSHKHFRSNLSEDILKVIESEFN
jgi:hypothetical protein